MEEYTLKAKRLISQAKSRHQEPKAIKNSLGWMYQKLDYIKLVLEDVNKGLKELGDEYIAEKNLSTEEIKDIQEINNSLAKKLLDDIGFK